MGDLRESLRILLLDGIVRRFFEDEAFRSGCVTGLIAAGIIGGFSNWLLGRYSRIDRFFRPTPRSFNEGPSPSTSTGGCVEASVALAIVIIGLVFLVLWFFGS